MQLVESKSIYYRYDYIVAIIFTFFHLIAHFISASENDGKQIHNTSVLNIFTDPTSAISIIGVIYVLSAILVLIEHQKTDGKLQEDLEK
jgi:uncharacterized membrane protein (GlpM family)